MKSRVVFALGARGRGVVGALAAVLLTLFVASPSWAVTYGTVTATAPTSPTCVLSGKTYTCSTSGTGSYSGNSAAPLSSVYLQVEVWRCPTSTLSVAVNGATPSGCVRQANTQSSVVVANCKASCTGSIKAAGSATCTVTSTYNYFTRATLWLSTGAVATGSTAVTKNVKGC